MDGDGKHIKALSKQVGGTHYQKYQIQPLEFCHKNKLGFIEGNVIKLVTRFRDKGGRQDLEKAIHYLESLIDFEYGSEEDAKKECEDEDEEWEKKGQKECEDEWDEVELG